jgi:hypothetical protein
MIPAPDVPIDDRKSRSADQPVLRSQLAGLCDALNIAAT